MARYRHYDYGQTKLLPISYQRQILPGSFEQTLSYLIDNKISLSMFDDRYQIVPAHDPSLLLNAARERQLQTLNKAIARI